MVPLTLQRDCDAWMRCAILLGQAKWSQEQTIWIHSVKQLFPLFPHEKQEICFHCAASTTDTFIHIHIHSQQHGVPLTQRRWQVDFKSAKSAPIELLGSSAGRLEMSSATQASSCHHGCLWWFFPPGLLQHWNQSIEQLRLLPVFQKILSTFEIGRAHV